MYSTVAVHDSTWRLSPPHCPSPLSQPSSAPPCCPQQTGTSSWPILYSTMYSSSPYSTDTVYLLYSTMYCYRLYSMMHCSSLYNMVHCLSLYKTIHFTYLQSLQFTSLFTMFCSAITAFTTMHINNPQFSSLHFIHQRRDIHYRWH